MSDRRAAFAINPVDPRNPVILSDLQFAQLRATLRTSTDPHLLNLGTGWGIADEYFTRSAYRLEPIVGPTEYNHLSVRGAAAIMFDRLLG